MASLFVAKERLLLASDGKTVVKANDPRGVSLLVAKGGKLTEEKARKYGLIVDTKGDAGDVLSLEAPPTLDDVAKLHVPTGTGATRKTIQMGGAEASQQVGQAEGAIPVETPQATAPPAPVTPSSEAPAQGVPADVNAQAPDLSASNAPQGTQETPTGAQGGTPLADDFPYKALLETQGFGTVQAVQGATRQQLLDLNFMGAGRVDEILEARKTLGQ